MSIATVIISAVILVFSFWLLYLYSVRRARFLVRQHFELLPKKKSKDAKITHARHTYQTGDTTKDSKNTKGDTKIKSFIEKRKIRLKSKIPSDEKSWAVSN